MNQSSAANQAALSPSPSSQNIALYSIYYGIPRSTELFVNAGGSEDNQTAQSVPPASLIETTEFVDVKSLHERGYGVTLAEAAALQKRRKTQPVHSYTNQDIERLRQGS